VIKSVSPIVKPFGLNFRSAAMSVKQMRRKCAPRLVQADFAITASVGTNNNYPAQLAQLFLLTVAALPLFDIYGHRSPSSRSS
jgi:hypothetical protein